jgi:hypothetical protein
VQRLTNVLVVIVSSSATLKIVKFACYNRSLSQESAIVSKVLATHMRQPGIESEIVALLQV